MTPIKISIERAREILSRASTKPRFVIYAYDMTRACDTDELAALAQYRIDAEVAIEAHVYAQKAEAVALEEACKENARLLTLLEQIKSDLDDARLLVGS